MSFFHNFQKIWNRTNSEYAINLKYADNPVIDAKTPVFASATGFFDPKTGVFNPNLFLNFFLQNFHEFRKTGLFQKNSELW